MIEESKMNKRFYRDWDKYWTEDGVLLRYSVQQSQKVSQLVVPEKFKTDMFRAYHDDLGHQVHARTLNLMERRLFWPGMDTFVSQKINLCKRCIGRKISPGRASDLVSIVSIAPMAVVCIYTILVWSVPREGWRTFLFSQTIIRGTPRLFLPGIRLHNILPRLCTRMYLLIMGSWLGFIVIRLTSSQN